MANRVQDYGMDVGISRRLNSRYDPSTEAEVLAWINALTGDHIPQGRENVHHALRNGQILVKLINVVYERTSHLPPAAQQIRRPIKVNTNNAPFKHMENIQTFLVCAEAYGVSKTSLFQTVDLYECRNMAQVLSTIMQLGTECQRNGFNGPACGPKPVTEAHRQFTQEQLRSGEAVLSQQSGTNKFASQKGMASMGGVRHVADIRCDQFTPEGAAVIGAQMGWNKGASQKGMSMGNVRHIADIRCDDFIKEGDTTIPLQMGTNKVASQKGMSFGAVRHVADIRCDNMHEGSQNVISLQYGSNKGASQKGMCFGSIRHVNDIKVDDMQKESSAIISLQMGLPMSQTANQSGMSFGAHRHIMDSY